MSLSDEAIKLEKIASVMVACWEKSLRQMQAKDVNNFFPAYKQLEMMKSPLAPAKFLQNIFCLRSVTQQVLTFLLFCLCGGVKVSCIKNEYRRPDVLHGHRLCSRCLPFI